MSDRPDTGTGLNSEASPSTSTGLLERVRGKDPQAWERLCRVYGPLVYEWARAAGLQDQDAADVGQDVFQTVALRMHTFRRDRPGDTFRGWLWTITRNKVGDHLRRRKAQPEAAGGTTAQQRLQALPEPPSETSQSSAVLSNGMGIMRRILAVIRNEFEEATWQAFWRVSVEGHAVDEIAEDLGMTPHAVRQAKYRVLRRLRDELAGGS